MDAVIKQTAAATCLFPQAALGWLRAGCGASPTRWVGFELSAERVLLIPFFKHGAKNTLEDYFSYKLIVKNLIA